jgi:hypothetical protein
MRAIRGFAVNGVLHAAPPLDSLDLTSVSPDGLVPLLATIGTERRCELATRVFKLR